MVRIYLRGARIAPGLLLKRRLVLLGLEVVRGHCEVLGSDRDDYALLVAEPQNSHLVPPRPGYCHHHVLHEGDCLMH